MKSFVVAAVAAASMAVAGTAQAQEALAKEKGCLGCHAVDTKKMGPALKDVSASLKGKADAEATIAGVLKSGKSTSGKSHPVAKASDDEVKSLAKWILSL